MLLGALGSSMIINGCAPDGSNCRRLQDVYDFSSYGRTPEEKAKDQKIFNDNFFTDHEFDPDDNELGINWFNHD